jgi:hypothetical protein
MRVYALVELGDSDWTALVSVGPNERDVRAN